MKLNDNFLINVDELTSPLNIANKKIEQKAQFEQSFEPEDISKHMDDFFASQQNENPNEPNFAVDTRNKRKAIPASKKRAIQNVLSELGRSYHESVPIDQIFQALESNDVIPLQEDGTKWAGMIGSCGECGTTQGGSPILLELATKTEEGYYPATNWLAMTVCTMQSGRLEFVGYLS